MCLFVCVSFSVYLSLSVILCVFLSLLVGLSSFLSHLSVGLSLSMSCLLLLRFNDSRCFCFQIMGPILPILSYSQSSFFFNESSRTNDLSRIFFIQIRSAGIRDCFCFAVFKFLLREASSYFGFCHQTLETFFRCFGVKSF